jgi:mitochondrial fission protein ELM1
MQPISQTEINSKISKSLLDRGRRELTPAQQQRVADLVGQIDRAVAARDRRDAETIASLIRMLTNPRGAARADAHRFTEFVAAIVRQEILDSKGTA